MIFAHGGFTNETLAFMGGGILFFVSILVALHLLAKRTKFYKVDFLGMTTPAKVIAYCVFLMVGAFVSSVITLVAAILAARILR
ncbi:MAG TPA: hypothetical protein VGD65_24295 [Chryseosolibacter sp.]